MPVQQEPLTHHVRIVYKNAVVEIQVTEAEAKRLLQFATGRASTAPETGGKPRGISTSQEDNGVYVGVDSRGFVYRVQLGPDALAVHIHHRPALHAEPRAS